MGKPRSCHSGSQPRVITEPTRRGAGGPRAPASGQLLSAAVSADAPTFQTSPGHRNEAWVCSHVATLGNTGPEDSESKPKRPYRAGPAPDPPTWCLSDPRRGCAEASATPMRIGLAKALVTQSQSWQGTRLHGASTVTGGLARPRELSRPQRVHPGHSGLSRLLSSAEPGFSVSQKRLPLHWPQENRGSTQGIRSEGPNRGRDHEGRACSVQTVF